ncbi:GPI mannosyltransferase, putative, partial [Perkinsus marinus ATCC 50983]
RMLPSTMFPFNRTDRLLLCGVLITNVSFIVASVFLYWLGLAVLKGKHAAMIAYYGALIFAMPMSNIFMSAVYTESFYSMLTFGGLLLLYEGSHLNAFRQAALLLMSAVLLSTATSVRSNGTLNAPFLISYGIHGRCLFMTIPLALLVLLPMGLHLNYARSLYCSDSLDSRPWCEGRGNIYSFIQKEYWHVGLLEYYTPNNIPNFLLAIPSMSIAIIAVVQGLRTY